MPVFARKLHLGSFDQAADGWLNTDVTPHMLVARVPALPWLLHRVGVLRDGRYAAYRSGAFRSLRYLDVSRRFRFDDETFDCVYASHMLEHLHPDVAEHCLREAHRVLRPGGVLRLAVPDLDQMVADYDPADPDALPVGHLPGSRTPREAHRTPLVALQRRLAERPAVRDRLPRCAPLRVPRGPLSRPGADRDPPLVAVHGGDQVATFMEANK